MLEIKTITDNTAYFFDKAVNEALAEGWDLVRRECFITGSDRATTLYAELERIVDEVEETSDVGHWIVTRNPHAPYKCSKCGYTAKGPWRSCPECDSIMRDGE